MAVWQGEWGKKGCERECTGTDVVGLFDGGGRCPGRPGTDRTASEFPAKGAGNSWQSCQSPAGVDPGGEDFGVLQPDEHPLRHLFLLRAFFGGGARGDGDRKSTRLNSSHRCISYAAF